MKSPSCGSPTTRNFKISSSELARKNIRSQFPSLRFNFRMDACAFFKTSELNHPSRKSTQCYCCKIYFEIHSQFFQLWKAHTKRTVEKFFLFKILKAVFDLGSTRQRNSQCGTYDCNRGRRTSTLWREGFQIFSNMFVLLGRKFRLSKFCRVDI